MSERPVEAPPTGKDTGEAPLRQAGLWSDAWRDLRRNPFFVGPALVIAVFVAIAIVPQVFARGVDPYDCQLGRSLGRPTGGHWFGFDLQGCDYLAKVVHGARVSMVIGLTSVLFAAVIAVFLGSLCGYYGGFLDSIVARVTDIAFAIPGVLGAIVILSVLGQRGLFQVTVVLVLLGWPTMLRLMRSSVLGVRELEYVQAARALGAGGTRVIFRHVLPNAITSVIVYGTTSVGIVIAAEAGLSFIGVGLQLPALSWGLMINAAQSRVIGSPHLLFFPGIFLSLVVLSFVLIGDALRDALDPRLR